MLADCPSNDESEQENVLPLFRPEAVKARQLSPLGTVFIAPSRYGILASLCGIALLAAIVAMLWLGSYSDKVRLTGVVVPDRGIVRLAATSDGIVSELFITQGQRVVKGEMLFMLGMAQEAAGGPSMRELLDGLRARRGQLLVELREQGQQDAASKRLAEANLSLHRNQIAALDQEMSVLRERIAAATDVRARYEVLRKQNYVTITTIEAADANLAEARLRLSALRRDRLQIQASLAKDSFDRDGLQSQSLERRTGLLRDLTQLDSDIAAIEARRSPVVRAPAAGIIASLDVARGEVVKPAMPLATIVPLGSRMEVTLKAPSADVGRLAPGQHAWLRFDAFPYQRYGQFGGFVQAISRTASAPDPSQQQRQPEYRVRVRLADQRLPDLRPDMSASAVVTTGRQPLWRLLLPRVTP